MDVEKFFDSCDPEQAIGIFRDLGMCEEVCNLLTKFDDGQERYFEVDGAVHPEPVKPQKSVLQGCPWSMVLIAAMMPLWMRANEHIDGKNVKAGIFVDDRAIWATGAGCVAKVARAHRAGRDIDAFFAWNAHPDKGECFASEEVGDEAQKELLPMAGPLHKEFKLLGIMHRVHGGKANCVSSKERGEGQTSERKKKT